MSRARGRSEPRGARRTSAVSHGEMTACPKSGPESSSKRRGSWQSRPTACQRRGPRSRRPDHRREGRDPRRADRRPGIANALRALRRQAAARRGGHRERGQTSTPARAFEDDTAGVTRERSSGGAWHARRGDAYAAPEARFEHRVSSSTVGPATAVSTCPEATISF